MDAEQVIGDLKRAIRRLRIQELAYLKPASLSVFRIRSALRGLSTSELTSLAQPLGPDTDENSIERTLDFTQLNSLERISDSVQSLDGANLHVLVMLQDDGNRETVSNIATLPTNFWLLEATISNAPIGALSRLYSLVDPNFGYYNPSHPPAIMYDHTSIKIHTVFTAENNCLHFENLIRDEIVTRDSPFCNLTIETRVSNVLTHFPVDALQRIYLNHYQSNDPEENLFQLIEPPVVYYGRKSDEFKYLGIEALLPLHTVKRVSLMSPEYCRNTDIHREYAEDENNMLVLSHGMQGFYAGFSFDVPIIKIEVASISPTVVRDGRFRVELDIRVISNEYKDIVFNRLKDDSHITSDPFVMTTSVWVKNPDVFCQCLQWKAKDTQDRWEDYYIAY